MTLVCIYCAPVAWACVHLYDKLLPGGSGMSCRVSPIGIMGISDGERLRHLFRAAAVEGPEFQESEDNDGIAGSEQLEGRLTVLTVIDT